MTLEEEVRLRVAAGVLLRRGLLELEDDPGRAAVRVGARGYRYLSHFWTLVGVLEAKSVRLEDDEEVGQARRRIAETWLEAGAPREWALQQADAALALLGVRASAGRVRRPTPVPVSARAPSRSRRPRGGGRGP